VVPGGTFLRGRSTTGTDQCPASTTCDANEQPEHASTVSSFALDTYEVTVGRFRKFVTAYTGTPPVAGAGAHPLITGTGWQSAWNTNLATSQSALITNLKCYAPYHTWKDTADGTSENRAINCVSWYEAFAFCIWDGGRLPTEAEWEYASAGGSDNRLYPWGSTTPNNTLANIAGGIGSVNLVGQYSAGIGKYGQHDLAGNVWEWAFDAWDGTANYTSAASNNYANTVSASGRARRGGSWLTDFPARVRASFRSENAPSSRNDDFGFRCARTP